MAEPTRRTNATWGKMALALAVSILLLHDGVVCQETTTDTPQVPDSPSTAAATPAMTAAASTNSLTDTSAGETQGPTKGTSTAEAVPAGDQSTAEPTAAALDATANASGQTADPETGSTLVTTQGDHFLPRQTTEAMTSGTATEHASGLATAGPTGTRTTEQAPGSTEPHTKPYTEPDTTVTTAAATAAAAVMPLVKCVDKEVVNGRDAVMVELREASSCGETKAKIESIASELCGNGCELEIFQEEDSNNVIVTGPSIEANAAAMAGKFNGDPVKTELGVMEAAPRLGKHPPTVLVALLVSGLLLAALLIGGYCLKERRGHSAKSMRLAEDSYQADEENQGNTLVSVAPLHSPEPQEKPSINGESPNGGKSQLPPTATNGHSTAKTPVADTEL